MLSIKTYKRINESSEDPPNKKSLVIRGDLSTRNNLEGKEYKSEEVSNAVEVVKFLEEGTIIQKRRDQNAIIEEYRRTLGDYESSEEQIKKRLEYLEAFCRNIIKQELREYAKEIYRQKGAK